MQDNPIATELRLTADGRRLQLVFADGRSIALEARHLRAACRCAGCTRLRHDGAFPVPDPSVAITTIDPIGVYGANIGFSDGHARGVFPWTYLGQLAAPDGN
jgi:prepilin-type processing-associated H-X9-DG protein